jgi:hypothetical protein
MVGWKRTGPGVWHQGSHFQSSILLWPWARLHSLELPCSGRIGPWDLFPFPIWRWYFSAVVCLHSKAKFVSLGHILVRIQLSFSVTLYLFMYGMDFLAPSHIPAWEEEVVRGCLCQCLGIYHAWYNKYSYHLSPGITQHSMPHRVGGGKGFLFNWREGWVSRALTSLTPVPREGGWAAAHEGFPTDDTVTTMFTRVGLAWI